MAREPLYYSAPDADLVPARPAAVAGAKVLGITLHHAQLQEVNLLEAVNRDGSPVYFNPVVEMPRRVGKTTGIYSTLVGRCIRHPNYQVTYCAQSGTKSRERFYDVKKMLDTTNKGKTGWVDRQSRGEERFEFANGSVFRFMPPKAENFRGDASDTIVFDEAQEVDPDDGADLIGSVLPLFDTRPAGQLIIAGTAGKVRGGLLWDALEQGRAGARGILEYAAKDEYDYMERLFSTEQDQLSDEALALLVNTHPGIGSLTTLEKITRNWKEMGTEQFLREYLGVWPPSAAVVGLDPVVWRSRAAAMGERPRSFVLSYDISPDRALSAIVAGWKDEEGQVHVEVLEARGGDAWVPQRLHELAVQYKVPVYYDTQGGSLDVAAALAVMLPKVKTHGLATAQYAAACASFVSKVVDGRLVHHDQPDLNRAVEAAARRRIGDGLWGWGRRASSASIAPLVAATMASFAVEGMARPRERVILSARA